MGDEMYFEDLPPEEGDEGMEGDGMEGMEQLPTEGEERNLTADGGIKKKFITLGTGYNTPQKGDEVTVHYVGKLTDGTQFDSSRDRNEPFMFKVGVGQVIQGWDTGVMTMRKGEKVLLTCTYPYAYGEAGSPPKIPPNATLEFEVELLSFKSVADLTDGEGGVIKKVLAEGAGWKKVGEEDIATVAYAARVHGGDAPFQQSEAAEFRVKDGLLCPAVGIAVRKMKRGEKVQLTVKPDWGFGAEGRGAEVPGGATLTIELELVSWKVVEALAPGVVKTTQNLVDGYDKPNECSEVTVKLLGKLAADGTVVIDKTGDGDLATWTTDCEQAPEGLDMCVLSMLRGERCTLEVAAAHAYGADGAPAGGEGPLALSAPVPGGAAVSFELELVEFAKDKENYEMTVAEKLDAADAKREQGNTYFRDGNIAKALKRYSKAVAHVEYDSQFSDEEKARSNKCKLSLYSNLAACHLAGENWLEGEKACNQALEIERSVKVLFRRAKAFRETDRYDEAEADLKDALAMEPSNKRVQLEMKQLKKLIAKQNRKDAKMYASVFSKMAKLSEPEPEYEKKGGEEEEEDVDTFNPETMITKVPK